MVTRWIFNQGESASVLNNDGSFDIENIEVYGNGGTLTITGSSDVNVSRDFILQDDNLSVINNNSGSVVVSHDLSLKGASNIVQNNGILTIGENLKIDSQSAVFTNNGFLSVQKDLNLNGSNANLINNDTVNIAGKLQLQQSNCSVSNNRYFHVSGNFQIGAGGDGGSFTNNSGGNAIFDSNFRFGDKDITVSNYADLTLSGIFEQIDNGSAFYNYNGSTWNYGGAVFDPDVRLYCNYDANTFRYNATGNQDIITPQDAYWHIILAGSGDKVTQNDLDINGSVNISGTANFDVGTNGNDLHVAGDWTNSGNFTAGTQRVTFDGSSLLGGSSVTNFYHLNITGDLSVATGKTFQVAGNWSNSGTFHPGSSLVVFNGTGAQSINNSSGESFFDLTINNSAGDITLVSGNVSVSDVLTMTNGNLILGSHDLIISTSGTIVGAGPATYIVAESSGKVHQTVTSGNTKTFPVGTITSFVPVILKNNGVTDVYGVRVFPDILTDGTAGTTIPEIDYSVKMTWVVDEGVAGGSDLDVTLQWNGSDEGSSFDRTKSGIGYHDGTDWSPQTPAAATGTDPYFRTRTNITGVGAFACGGECTRMGDDQDPVATCRNDTTVNTDNGECYHTAQGDEFDLKSATDNCEVVDTLVRLSGETTLAETHTRTLDGTVFNKGETTVTWIVFDRFGNGDSCSFTVTIEDNEDPVALCKDITVYLDENTGQVTITPDSIDGGSSDNCSTITRSISKNIFYCSNIGDNPDTLIVVDNAGNSDSCMAMVTVEYQTPPKPSATPEKDTICNDSSNAFTLDNSFNNVQFTWTAAGTSGITGYSNGNYDGTNGLPYTIPAQTLDNPSDSAGFVVYKIVPKIYNLCELDTIFDTVWVEPTPKVGRTDAESCSCSAIRYDL